VDSAPSGKELALLHRNAPIIIQVNDYPAIGHLTDFVAHKYLLWF
jgi:hypothetical protein